MTTEQLKTIGFVLLLSVVFHVAIRVTWKMLNG
jgi:hypothetical protein